MTTASRSFRPAALTQLELDLGEGNRARISIDLPVRRAEDGGLIDRDNSRVSLTGSTQAAADILGVSDETVRDWIERGYLRGGRVGRNYKVDLLNAQELKDRAFDGAANFINVMHR